MVFYICKFYNNIIHIYRQKELICLNFTKCSSKQSIKIETKEWDIFKINPTKSLKLNIKIHEVYNAQTSKLV